MTASAFAVLAAVVLAAAFVQATIGVGFALIVAPVMAVIAPELVPACLLALMVPLNVYVAWRERGALDRHGAGWITAGRVLGTFAGLWILAVLTAGELRMVIGVATIAAALATLAAPSFRPTRHAFVATGVVTGISETATGIGGPPLALVYQHHPAPVLRSTIAFCFVVGELMSLAVLAAAGNAGVTQLVAALELLPALVAGAVASRYVHGRVDARTLRALVLGFAIVSGAVLLLR